MLEVEKLGVKIGSATILREVSLQVPVGAMCGLIGRNGAGKTTFLRSVMGLNKVHTGRVAFDHVNLLEVHGHKRAHMGIGYMPEDRRLVPDLTVQENVLMPAWATGMEKAEDRLEWVYEIIPEVREFAPRRASMLSGGQQKLVALARALMCGTRMLLLDEPFEGVAPALSRRLAQVLSTIKGEGLSILLAESNEKHVEDLLDSIFVIERGEITTRGA